MSTLWQDVRHGLRLLARSPGFTAVAILTLAIALGANTAVFSIMNGVLLKALAYPDPDRIVAVSVSLPPSEGQSSRSSYLDSLRLAGWPERSGTIERLAAYRTRAFTLSGMGDPERLTGASVRPALFPLLRVPPALGRTFAPEEERPGRGQVVVLSHGLWRRRFAGNPGILGRSLRLDGVPYSVIGVMPAGFAFPQRGVEIWTPLGIRASAPLSAGTVSVEYLPVVARLREGVSPRQAETESQAIFRRLGESLQGPGDNLRNGRVRLVPLRDEMVGEVRPALVAMGAAVGLVLAIACINLANLLLARNGARRREMAIRTAVGGSRVRLVRQMLTESIVLSLAGGAAGVLLAIWIQRLLPRLVPHQIPRVEEIRLDARVFLFALLLAAATGVLFGLLPALRSAGEHLAAPLHGGSAEGSARSRSTGLLVVAEVALAFVLLVGGGLLVRSYVRLAGVPLGYEPSRVLAATVDLDRARYLLPGRAEAFFDELLRRLEDHRGVEAAGVVSFPPLAPGFSLMSVAVPGAPRGGTLAVPQLTSPGYLRAMALHLASGRWLTAQDVASGAQVAVVSETFLHRYLPCGRPLGRRLGVGRASLEVVGVVRDVHTVGVEAPPEAEFFTSYRQAAAISGRDPERLTLAVRTAGDPLALLPYLRTLLSQLDPELALEDVRTMDARLAASEAEPRFYALLLGAFASIALALAAAGVYGVLACSVARQTRAIGVRRALGARGKDILAMIVGRGLALIAAGIVLGLGMAATVTRVLSHLLFGTTARDPLPYVVAALALAGAGVLACYLPARQATRVDPIEALRVEA